MRHDQSLDQQHCADKAGKLAAKAAATLLAEIPAWKRQGRVLKREFKFADHFEAIAFVNAVAWISNTQNHHPDMEVGYNRVAIAYTTHSAKGLTRNDFICAARVSALGKLP